nr:MAG TPA: hypothetical protein [Inoviridae sp.]
MVCSYFMVKYMLQFLRSRTFVVWLCKNMIYHKSHLQYS